MADELKHPLRKRLNRPVLIIILLSAFLLRFWNLGSYPALNADEAAIGYNAYSLLETGKDEHGNTWPLHFQSFNDYKPGLYFYLVLPFVKLAGLNEWAVRIPNAALGVLTVYFIYLLANTLFKDKKLKVQGLPFGIIPAALLAISPWHIHFSRGAWEVNSATFFITAGILFYLKSLKNLKYLYASTIFFVLSLYTYHSARIVTPFIIIGLLPIYYKEVLKHIKFYSINAIIAFILLIPLAGELIRPEITSRASGVGLLADTGPVNRINEQRGEHNNYDGTAVKVFHNKYVNYSLEFIDNYTAHFHGLFLFISGDDIQRDKVPETGQMYLSDFLWLVIGISWLCKNINRRTRIIIHWLFVAPVAASLTFQSPHALRSENMVIPLILISSVGFVVLWNSIGSLKRYLLVICHLSLVILIFWQFARYEHMYWIHMAKEYPFSSQYGVKELVDYVNENKDKYENIVVTLRYDQPYVLFLFYLKYDPSEFQKNHSLTARDQYGFSTVPAFDKYIFRNIDWDSDKIVYPNSLIIGTAEEIPKEANIVKKIIGKNGYEYFDIVAN